MASFLRAKQSGMQKDLSATILPQLFIPDEQARFGINSQISCLAYDPVQSLLAVGTNESKFSRGQIYVFGRDRIQKSFVPARPTSIRSVQFCASRLISLDTKGELTIWDLDTGKRVAGGPCGSAVTFMITDPMLDWAMLGHSNGDVSAYDIDRARLSPFRIPNFWKDKDSKAKMVTLVSMQMHPRDVGKMLIGYSHGAVLYSFKQNQPTKFFEYVLQPGAPGGNAENIDTVRRPKMTHAVWHPTGTFILTAHDDGSLVFWDPKDGRLVMARSLYGTKIDQVVRPPPMPKTIQPFSKIAWCCKENPDDTALLVAGGQAVDEPEKGLTFLELGQTPNYATSSWQILEGHLQGKRQQVLQTPPGTDVADFCLCPRSSPHFAGAQDPIAVVISLSSGELITMSFPSGYPISPTNQLHPSLSFVHPFVTKVVISTLDRARWLGMMEKRNMGDLLLKGGAEAPKPRRRYEGRNIIQVAHADSTIRLWDLGHADEIENTAQLQVDMARSLGRYEDVEVSSMHLAPNTGEFAAGTRTGEVVIWRWGGNPHLGRDEPSDLKSNPGGLTDITSRTEPSLKEGLQPYVLYEMMRGAITTVAVSDVGFVAVGSEGGFFSIIDLRGPAIIFQASVAEFAKPDKRSSFLKKDSKSSTTSDYPVKIDFGVMTLDDDNYSSIACFVGTNQGKVATFKLLPSGNGYSVKLAGVTFLSDKVVALCPIVAETGHPAAATPEIVDGLRNGQHVNGVLVAVTLSEVRVFKPATSKGASKSFDDILCDAAAVAKFELQSCALVATFGDGTVRAFSLPGLKEISKAPLPMLDASRSTLNIVATTGDVIGWAGPSELVVIPVWGTGVGRDNLNNDDKLVNPEAVVPPRPTISNMQWLSGTQYVSPTDLDLLIGGPDRPPSKRMMEAAAAEERIARTGSPGSGRGAAGSSRAAGASQEGWGEYLTRQLNERTERLNIMGENMENLNEQSAGWADDVNKFVGKQKRSMVLGSLKSKFF